MNREQVANQRSAGASLGGLYKDAPYNDAPMQNSPILQTICATIDSHILQINEANERLGRSVERLLMPVPECSNEKNRSGGEIANGSLESRLRSIEMALDTVSSRIHANLASLERGI